MPLYEVACHIGSKIARSTNKTALGCSRMELILNAAFSWVVKLKEDPGTLPNL